MKDEKENKDLLEAKKEIYAVLIKYNCDLSPGYNDTVILECKRGEETFWEAL